MIFMSQSGLTDAGREAEWDAWYAEHLRIMVTVPGISSAQRFRTASPGHAPSLAMYTVASPSVFSDPYYLSVRGMGEWAPLIDRRHYRRNLFAGLDAAPAVPDGAVLLVADREHAVEVAGFSLTWLTAVDLDRSTPYRGVAVVSRAAGGGRALRGVAVYEPVSPPVVPP